MMQLNQIRDEFSSVERCIDNAALLCQASNQVPEDLRDCISELDRESDQAKQMLENENNPNRINACIDRLEKLGDRACHVCEQAGSTVDQQVQSAVKQAHDAISDLKHRLH